jgi:ABC-2 type transport system permease protein
MKSIFRSIRQYARVYKVLLWLNLLKFMTYRAHLVSSSIAHTIWGSFVIIQMVLLTSKTSHVFGWSRDELLMLAAVYNLIYSFFYMFFARGFNELSLTIHFGRLDGILTKPIDSQFLLTCISVTYTHLIRFVIGFGFLWYMIGKMQISITPILVFVFMGLMIFSVMIIYSVWMLVMTLTIWFPRLSNLTDLLYEVNQVSKFPQEIYRGASIYLLFILFPLTVIVVTPVKFFLQKALVSDLVVLPCIAFGVFFASRFFWRFALRFYTSASG